MGSHRKLKFWTHSGVKVYDNTAAPTSWTDLDLSSVVSKNRAIVLLKIVNKYLYHSDDYYFRANGDVEEAPNENYWAGGVALAVIGEERAAYIMMETDTNGIVEWKTRDGRNADILVVGYVK